MINKENLTSCPLCRGELYAYSVMGISRVESAYCPICDITRQEVMSIPYLCSKCHSSSFYEKDRKHYCWYCGNDKFTFLEIEDADKKGFFDSEGFNISRSRIERKDNTDCKHEHKTYKRHSQTVFKFTCESCKDVEYTILPKWWQQKHNIKNILEI